jgi:hypothetical protein
MVPDPFMVSSEGSVGSIKVRLPDPRVDVAKARACSGHMNAQVKCKRVEGADSCFWHHWAGNFDMVCVSYRGP